MGDAHELEPEPALFDAALSRWGLMLMLDPARVLARVHAALRPGAGIAAAVWDEPEHVPFLRASRRALERVLEVPRAGSDEPGPFRLAREGALDELLAPSTAGNTTSSTPRRPR